MWAEQTEAHSGWARVWGHKGRGRLGGSQGLSGYNFCSFLKGLEAKIKKKKNPFQVNNQR